MESVSIQGLFLHRPNTKVFENEEENIFLFKESNNEEMKWEKLARFIKKARDSRRAKGTVSCEETH